MTRQYTTTTSSITGRESTPDPRLITGRQSTTGRLIDLAALGIAAGESSSR